MAVITAVASVPLVITIGLAVDYTRASAVRSELQRAVDSAALAAARVVVTWPPNDATVRGDGRMYFYANYHTAYAGSILANGGPTVTIREPNRDGVTVTAAADVPMVFGQIIGRNRLRVDVTAEAERYQRGMELVLALDNTNSMSGQRLTNLKAGAKDLLDIVYGLTNDTRGKQVCTTAGTPPKTTCTTDYSLLVGMVPFVATVNVSPARMGIGVPSGIKQMPVIVPAASVSAVNWGASQWKGCVKARAFPYEEAQADRTPTEQPFAPYFWPASPSTVTWGGKTYAGPNPWTSTTTESWTTWPSAGTGANFQKAYIGWRPGTDSGPNKGCGYPILPLQPSKSMAYIHLQGLEVGATNGTTVTTGASWSWRLLSPRWRSWWEGGTWYTYTGTTRRWNTTPMGAPRDYGGLLDKVVVLFTDGQNEMGDGTPESVQSCCSNAYGQWSTKPLGTTPVTELNARTVAVCNAMKAQGIKIYVILLYTNPPPSVLNVFNQNGCASSANHFFLSATANDLRAAFREVGASLSNLRLVR